MFLHNLFENFAAGLFRLSIAAASLAILTLAGCGGGTDGDAKEQIRPEVTSVYGTYYVGVPELQDGPPDSDQGKPLRLRGVEGLGRFIIPSLNFTYTAKTQELTGPYALGRTILVDAQSNYSQEFVVSLTTKAGVANVTPLTTLVAAQLVGQAPSVFFDSLSVAGDARLTQVTDAGLADAQQKVIRYLSEQFGFTVPANVGDFITTPFAAQAGDPMFDTIVSLNARLAALNTNFVRVGRAIAREVSLCQQERVGITQAGVERDFCPASKSAVRDGTDQTIVNYSFVTTAGANLTVAARERDVLSATLRQAPDRVFSCSGAGCAGLTVGAAAADGSRSISLASVTLSGTAGITLLNGTVLAFKPGPIIPTLPCTVNRYFIFYPDDRVEATCAAPDGFFGTAVGDVGAAGTTRRVYSFRTDQVDPPLPAPLEVRAEGTNGQQVVSVRVPILDPDTGAIIVSYECRGSACNGVTVGPARDDLDLVSPYTARSRLITLEDTVLTARNADGTPAALGPITVRANLDTLEIPNLPTAYATAPCLSSTQRLTALRSDVAQPVDVCPADPNLTTSYFLNPDDQLSTSVDPSLGVTILYIGSLYVDPIANVGASGGLSFGSGVRVLLEGETVTEVSFTDFDFVPFRCRGSACAGITVSAADSSGRRTVTATNVTLREVESYDLPGDRTAILNGSFISAPPPP